VRIEGEAGDAAALRDLPVPAALAVVVIELDQLLVAVVLRGRMGDAGVAPTGKTQNSFLQNKQATAATFTGEVHVVYKRELKLDDPVRVRLQLVGYDEKRLHIFEELCHAREGWVSATCELISLHVDLDTRKVAPFPADIAGNLAEMASSHGWLPTPEIVGRSIRRPGRLLQA